MPNKFNKFYITSPIFYPNGELHIGHAYTMIMCDIFTRFHKLMGEHTYFLTGADENSNKIDRTAVARGVEVNPFLDEMSDKFKKLYEDIGASYDQFIRTSDEKKHWPGAIKMWNKLVEAGDIYKSAYKGYYCPECEAFYTEKDLFEGKCPLHHIVPQVIEEENYFFKLSRFNAPIKAAIESGELEIMPVARKNEILSLLNSGLQDVSFSRPAKTLGRGIPVPGDETQIIYVWCDALVNYISALGYGSGDGEGNTEGDGKLFTEFWPADVHVIGKDILRFHAAIWPGMLLSAGLPLPKRILVHGLIMSGGKKMSKSIGNTIAPETILSEYGREAFRYYFARHIPIFDDGEMTMEIFHDSYNAGLANGIGNLTNRIMKMAETYLRRAVDVSTLARDKTLPEDYVTAFERFDINCATDIIWREIAAMDGLIQETQPFKLVKENPEKGEQIIHDLVLRLYTIGRMLTPILPETAEKIIAAVKSNKMPEEALFLRN